MGILSLFSDDYLFSRWEHEYREYIESGEDTLLLERLKMWVERDTALTETQVEGQFIDLFFKQTWGYWGTGEREAAEGFCLKAQFAVSGAGQGGGTGSADLALGWFNRDGIPQLPQVLCEFKDIRSSLDAPQNRKGNNRSPVRQCFDYLKHAFDQTDSHSPLVPTWGIVTDMNEFRLYARRVGDSHCLRFFIQSPDMHNTSLVSDSNDAAFLRFLFQKVFRQDMVLAPYGKSALEKILEGQWVQEKELEKDFYKGYQSYRVAVYEAIKSANPGFQGTRGKLVRLTQRFLDRCIFILFCEDMGNALEFPTDLLRDMLIRESTSPTYHPDFNNIWELVKQLFRTMRDGGLFPPQHTINRFNGGLFEELPELEALSIPNRVFCSNGQGESPESLAEHPDTLLYLSAHYNFGQHGTAHERTITLYALGRIFEQSITELEFMEAEAEGRESIASLSKRKRDGVYYTPEWVTNYIVKETIGARLAEIREEVGLEFGMDLPEAEIIDLRKSLTSKRRKKAPNNSAARYFHALNQYEEALNNLTVLDPACGSGAFLIQALQFLLAERRSIVEERERMSGNRSLFDIDENLRAILSQNLYGVDINPESVEITQLALWLHTASPGKPLSNLDEHIRCGNSLVGPDFIEFYNDRNQTQGNLFEQLDEQTREDVNVFDWKTAFPEILGDHLAEEERGFDCVIGNPPYVKLQNFRRIKEAESEYYINKRVNGHVPLFESAQSGNFDIYLLFIEKGVSLLNSKGRMGFIAPSLWLKNEYGLGLRKKIKRLSGLDRWIDFKSFQVFEEATTYTALQFFCKQGCNDIRFYISADGDISGIDWIAGGEDTIKVTDLPDNEAWNFVGKKERKLLNRLATDCQTLEASSSGITVGIQTSADLIYHLQRIAQNRYKQKGSRSDGVEYEIEDEIMHPLISGPEAKRYQLPDTDTYLLFPYIVDKGRARIFTEKEMAERFPKAWDYLKSFEQKLRGRERGKMDKNDSWWGYNYPKNLDKQEKPKLLVPRLVTNLSCVTDNEGNFFLDNVDVGGVISENIESLWYLCGILNAPVCNYVFRKTSKPFRGEFLSANKQYIAFLPVPDSTPEQKEEVGYKAKTLQGLHTTRRVRIASLQQRINSDQCINENHSEEWLWADVRTLDEWKRDAPDELTGRFRTAWAKEQRTAKLEDHLENMDAILHPNAPLSVLCESGEVSLCVASQKIVTIYLDQNEADFVAAQWRQAARTINVTEKFTGKKLIDTLLKLRKTENAALRNQVVSIDAEIQSLDLEIEQAERDMNQLVYQLYKLTEDEIKLVEAG